MKHTIVTIAAALLLTACSHTTPDPHIPAIEADIKANAMGMETGYKPGTLDTVLVLRKEDALKDFSKQIGHDVTQTVDTAIKVFTGVYEDAQKEEDNSTYHVWKAIVERLQRLKAAKAGQVDYSVYKYTYTINSGLNPKERITVVNYYFFDQNDKLVGHVTDELIKQAKLKFIRSDYQAYDMVLVHLQTGLPFEAI